jgi:small-conductance mechanosensitive channel
MPLVQAFLGQVAGNPYLLIDPAAVFLVTLGAGLLVGRLLLKVVRAWTKRTQSRPALILEESLRTPLWIWVLILAVHLAVQASAIPPNYADNIATGLSDLFIASLTWMAMRVARETVRHYGGQIPGAMPVTTLTQNLAQIAVLILGITVLLGPYIHRLTPILTALGVGGLAVALALQDTLSNLFSGFYVAVARQVRLGDYIKLNSGEEGYVVDISWRSTSIRALQNNMIIVPNAKLAQAVITNYHLPEARMSASIRVGVDYSSDADHVERVLLEIATSGANDIPGLLADPAPFVMFDPGFGDSSLDFTLIYQVAEFVNQYKVRHELRKRILRRFREEGINIPFPTRTLHVDRSAEGAGQS